MALNSYLSIVTLNVNELNAPIKRQSIRMDKKTKPINMLSTRNPFRPKDTSRFKVRGWKTIYNANGHQKKTRVAILISDKLD